MRGRIFLIQLCLFWSAFTFGQLETANWFFGQHMAMRFEGNNITALEGSVLSTGEGCASISDKFGNLLFYTDGSTVYRRDHEIMRNGIGLKGNSSSTQSAIVVPYPSQENKYIIFTVSADDLASPGNTTNEGLHFYVVDMSLDDGFGEVIFPPDNNLLPLVSEKIAAVKKVNMRDYWVVTHFEDTFYAYSVTENGVSREPVRTRTSIYQDPDTYPVTSRGYLKIAPNGNTLAIAHLTHLNYEDIPFGNLPFTDTFYPTNGPYANGWPGLLVLYRFDRRRGTLSNETILDATGTPYGIEFSPDSQKLYANLDFHARDGDNNTTWTRGELVQYQNLLNNSSYNGGANPIIATKRVVNTFTEMDTPSSLYVARGALQLALNNRIYYSRDYKGYLSHLKNPNADNPEFEEVGFSFDYYSYNINTRYGLPPFASNGTYAIEVNNIAELQNVCLGNEVQFNFTTTEPITILSYTWDLGDGTTSTIANPRHTYASAGTYQVILLINTLEFGELELATEVVVYPLPEIRVANLSQCDLDEDGVVVFDLSQANSQLSDDETIIYTYYLSELDAQNERNPIDAIYTSRQNNEVIWVKATNINGCRAISTINLLHEISPLFTVDPISVCVENEEVEVRLTDYIDLIEQTIDPITIIDVKFYSNRSDLNQEVNDLSVLNIRTSEQMVYARVKSFDASCDVIVVLTLVPSQLPIFTLTDLTKCPNTSVVVQAPAGYIYQWNGLTGEDLNQNLNESSITISNPGSYSLTISNESGCELIKQFLVTDLVDVQLIQVRVENNNQIFVDALGEELMYSLDGINWQYENVFVNLTSGNYTVYIKSKNGCVIQSDEVVIFLWVNFLSPNKDGSNDVWRIPGLEKYQNVEVKIFNRYGKLLLEKTLDNENVIWDGKYHNKLQPSDSYWYTITIPNHIKYSGHLLLKNKI